MNIGLIREPKITTCIVNPGEVIYLPDRWLHATCNLDDVSIALGYIGGVAANQSLLVHAAQDGNVSMLREAVAQITLLGKGISAV